jgi:hypothetical protein
MRDFTTAKGRDAPPTPSSQRKKTLQIQWIFPPNVVGLTIPMAV